MSSAHRCAAKPPSLLLRCKRAIPSEEDKEQVPQTTQQDKLAFTHTPPTKRQRSWTVAGSSKMITASVEFTVHFSPTPSSPKTDQNFGPTTLAQLAASEKHSIGWFVVLPVELLYSVFSLLDIRALGYLSLTSKETSAAVLGYLQSGVGLKHIMPIVATGHRTSVDPLHFREVGKQRHSYE